MKSAPIFLALLTLTGGCASQTSDFPSLAIRDVELAAGRLAVPDVPPPPAPPRAALDRLVPLMAEARAAHAAFNVAAEQATTRVRAASGAASGSESWSVAQVALADLRTRRSTAMIALADLDRLYVDASSAGESTAEIAPVRGEVAELIAQEDRLLDTLIGGLAR